MRAAAGRNPPPTLESLQEMMCWRGVYRHRVEKSGIVNRVVNSDMTNRNKHIQLTRGKQAGLSLIELMVAMALGLFLLAGIVQVFLGSKQSFNVIHTQTHMQENGRFAMEFIAQSLKNAGYLNAGDMEANPEDVALYFFNAIAFPASAGGGESWPSSGSFEADAVISGSDNGAGTPAAKADTDVVRVRLMGDFDGSTLDCEGVNLPGGPPSGPVEMVFYVNANNELVCQGVNGDDVVLVEGVEDMQIQYGVGADGEVTGYVNASNMDATDWAGVLAVRLSVLAISAEEHLARTTMTYDLLDKVDNSFNDGRARQVFTQTTMIRNKAIIAETDD